MIDLISNKPALPVLLDFQSALPNPPTCSRWLFSLTSSFIHSLHRSFPYSEISLLLQKKNKELYKNCPFIKKIYTFKNKPKSFIGVVGVYIKAYLYSKIIINSKFNVILMPRFDTDRYYETFIACNSGTKYILGFSEKTTRLKKLLNRDYDNLISHPIEKDNNTHEVESNNHIIKALAGIISHKKRLYPATKKTIIPMISCKRTIVIAPGSREEEKKWQISKYLKIISYLLSKKYLVIAVGGPDEITESEFFDKNLKKNKKFINLIGSTSLSDVYNLLRKSDLYIGNDTGIKHMAAAAGIPVVEINRFPRNNKDFYHAYSPNRFGAWEVPNKVIQPNNSTMLSDINSIEVKAVILELESFLYGELNWNL